MDAPPRPSTAPPAPTPSDNDDNDRKNLADRVIVYPGFGEMRFGILEGAEIRNIRNIRKQSKHRDGDGDDNEMMTISNEQKRLLEVYETASSRMRTDWTYRWPSKLTTSSTTADDDDVSDDLNDGESIADVQTRCINSLRDILTKHTKSKHVVIVSHGRTNRILLATLLCKRNKNSSVV